MQGLNMLNKKSFEVSPLFLAKEATSKTTGKSKCSWAVIQG